MGTLKNCKECGRVYMEIGQGMCQACYEKELEAEQIVYSYVRDHDKCSIREIVESTGVKEKVVLRMLKNGRFIASGLEITYPCQSCGTLISTGKLCTKCSNNIISQAEKLQESRKVGQKEKNTTYFHSNFHR